MKKGRDNKKELIEACKSGQKRIIALEKLILSFCKKGCQIQNPNYDCKKNCCFGNLNSFGESDVSKKIKVAIANEG